VRSLDRCATPIAKALPTATAPAHRLDRAMEALDRRAPEAADPAARRRLHLHHLHRVRHQAGPRASRADSAWRRRASSRRTPFGRATARRAHRDRSSRTRA